MGVVLKYGGTSVESTSKIIAIARYIQTLQELEKQVVVVVSAMGKTTDELITLAKELSTDLPKRELDTLLSTGEQKTIALLTMALHSIGVDAISLTGLQAGFITTSSHTKGIIMDVKVDRVLQHINQGKVVVVAGFQGVTESGDITTLGRGGSDTSAVALAAKLGFPCEIYTDVDGMYTVDPRYYPNAKKLQSISFEECMEMSALGAGIIETRAVELAKKYNVPLYIARSLSEKGSGTTIMNEHYLFEDKPITGLSTTDNVVMVTLEGMNNDNKIVAKIFHSISNRNINLDMISQTIDNANNVVISFSIDAVDLPELRKLVQSESNLFESLNVEIKDGMNKLSLIGVGMASNFGVASRVFSTLSQASIPFYHVSTSEISISCTINTDDKNRAIRALAEEFHL